MSCPWPPTTQSEADSKACPSSWAHLPACRRLLLAFSRFFSLSPLIRVLEFRVPLSQPRKVNPPVHSTKSQQSTGFVEISYCDESLPIGGNRLGISFPRRRNRKPGGGKWLNSSDQVLFNRSFAYMCEGGRELMWLSRPSSPFRPTAHEGGLRLSSPEVGCLSLFHTTPTTRVMRCACSRREGVARKKCRGNVSRA